MTRIDVWNAKTWLEQQDMVPTIEAIMVYLHTENRDQVRRHLRHGPPQPHRAPPPRRLKPISRGTDQPKDRATEAAEVDALIAAARARGAGAAAHHTPAMEPDPEPEGKEARHRAADLRLARRLLDEAVPWLRGAS